MAAQPFNLVANLKLQGPQNVNQVVRRLQSGLKNIKTKIDIAIPRDINRRLRAMNRNLANTSTHLRSIAADAQAASKAFQSMGIGLTKVGQAGTKTQAIGNNMRNVAKQTQTATSEMVEFGRISALAARRFLAFSIPAGIMVGLVVQIRTGIKAAVEFEREMVRVQQVTGRTTEGLRGLTDEIGRLSTSFGSSSVELVKVTRILTQAGLTARQTQTALEAISKSDLSPTFNNMTETTEGVIAAMRQFNIQAHQVEAALGSMNAVAGGFAVESTDLISAIRRTGGAFQAAGGDLRELIALFTSVRATTRESADSIATGFRTIFTRMQRPRTIKFLREFNIELQNGQGQFIGAYEAVEELSRALKSLDPKDIRFSRIIEELGGFRQVSKVIPLIQQFETSQQALNVAIAGQESVTEDAAIAQDALAVRIAKVGEEYNKLFREVTQSDIFKSLADFSLEFAKNLTQVVRQMKPLVPLLATIATMQSMRVMPFIAGGFFQGLKPIQTKQAEDRQAAQMAAQQGAAISTGSKSAAAGGAAHAQQIQTSNQALVNALTQHATSLQTLFTGVNSTISSNTAAIQQNTIQLQKLMATLMGIPIGFRPAASGLIIPKGLAAGGSVGSTDTVPAMLTPGEFVVNRKAAQRFGYDNLWDINKAKGFAQGGSVGSYGSTIASSQIQMGNLPTAITSAVQSLQAASQALSNVAQSLSTAGQQVLSKITSLSQLPYHPNRVNMPRGVVGSFDQMYTKSFVARSRQRPEYHKNFPIIGKELTSAERKRRQSEHVLGDLGFFARGGLVPGVGSGDTVPAMLEKGEFVIRKRAVQEVGLENLFAVNAQKFAKGGPVGAPGAFGGGSMQALVMLPLMASFAKTMIDAENSMQKWIDGLLMATTTIYSFTMGMGVLHGVSGQLQKLAPVFKQMSTRGMMAGLRKTQIGRDIRGSLQPTGGTALGKQVRMGHLNRLAASGAAINTFAIATGAATSALLYFGQKANEEATKMASNARTEAAMDKAIEKRRTGSMLSSAGTGVAAGGSLGFLIGSIAGPLGSIVGGVVGAAIGGLGGLLYGLFGNMDKAIAELRKAQREAQVEEAVDSLQDALARLTSGDIDVAGSRQLGDLGKGITDMRSAAQRANLAGETQEAMQHQRALRGMSSQVQQVRDELVKSVTSLEEFRDRTSAGAEIITMLASVQKTSAGEIERAIEKDIAARLKDAKNAEEARRARERTMSLVMVLTQFEAAVSDTVLSMQQLSTASEDMVSLARGQVTVPSFTGLPGFGDFSRITEGTVMDINAFNRAIEQSVGGLGNDFGKFTAQYTQDLASIIHALPEVLRDLEMSGPLDDEQISLLFADTLKDRFEGTGIDKRALDTVVSTLGRGIEQLTTGQGEGRGAGRFFSLLRGDPQELLEQIGVKEFESVFKQLGQIAQGQLQATQMLHDATKRRVELEVDIFKKQLDLAQQELNNRREIFELTNRLPYQTFGSGRERGAQAQQIRGLLAGTQLAGADPFDSTRIGESLRSANNEISRLSQQQQEMTAASQDGSKAFIQLTDELGNLNIEAQKYRSALQVLTDTTGQATQIRQELNMLEQAEKGRYDLMERYAFGTDAERQNILRGILDTITIASGAANINQIPGERRGMVLQMAKEFDAIRAVMFGVNDEGQGLRGFDFRTGVTGDAAGRINIRDMFQPFFGADNLGPLVPDITQVSPEQQVLIDQLERLHQQRHDAEVQLLEGMRTVNDKLVEDMRNSFSSLVGELTSHLQRIEIQTTQRQMGSIQGQIGTLEGQQKALTDIQQMAEAAGLLNVSMQGAARIFQAIGTEDGKERVQQLRRAREMSGEFGDMGALPRELFRDETFLNKITRVAVDAGATWQDTGDKEKGQLGIIEAMRPIFKRLEREGMTQPQIDKLQTTIPKMIQEGAFRRIMLVRTAQENFNTNEASMSGTVRTAHKERLDRLQQNLESALAETFVNASGAIGAEFATMEQDILSELMSAARIPEDEVGGFEKLMNTQSDAIAGFASVLGQINVDNINSINESLTKFRSELSILDAQLKEMRAAGGPVAQPRAFGGPIFKQQGTDTVPAMLTPGEFVVNRKAAQQNMGLLRSINNGGGGAYSDEGVTYARRGGEILPIEERKRLIQQRAMGRALMRGRSRESMESAATLRVKEQQARQRLRERLINKQEQKAVTNNQVIPAGDSLDDRLYASYMRLLEAEQSGNQGAAQSEQRIINVLKERLASASAQEKGANRQKRQGIYIDGQLVQMGTAEYNSRMAEMRSRLQAEHAANQPVRMRTVTGADFAGKTHIGPGWENTMLGRKTLQQPRSQWPEWLKNLTTDVEGYTQQQISALTTDVAPLFERLYELMNQERTLWDSNTPDMQFHNFDSGIDKTLAGAELAQEIASIREKIHASVTKAVSLGAWVGDPDTFRLNELQKQIRSHVGNITSPKGGFRPRTPPGRMGPTAYDTFHSGGLVPGTGDRPAILQGGEFVLPRNVVQAMSKGGVVQGYQDGGAVSSGGGGQSDIQLVLGSGVTSAFDKFINDMRESISGMQGIFNVLPDAFSGFENSANIVNEAMSIFASNTATLSTNVSTLPEQISVALGEFNTSMLSSAQNFGVAIANFGVTTDKFVQGTEQLASIITNLAVVTDGMRSAASELRDALAQEISINVTHTHEPITVRVEGGSSTTEDGSAFSDMVMRVVGPEIDRLRDRIRDNGFGIA